MRRPRRSPSTEPGTRWCPSAAMACAGSCRCCVRRTREPTSLLNGWRANTPERLAVYRVSRTQRSPPTAMPSPRAGCCRGPSDSAIASRLACKSSTPPRIATTGAGDSFAASPSSRTRVASRKAPPSFSRFRIAAATRTRGSSAPSGTRTSASTPSTASRYRRSGSSASQSERGSAAGIAAVLNECSRR